MTPPLRAATLLAITAAGLAACDGPAATETRPVAQAPTRPAAKPARPVLTAPSPARPAPAFQLKEVSATLDFRYGWPAEAASLPRLAARLRTELAAARAETAKTGDEDRRSAPADHRPFHQHSFNRQWRDEGRSLHYLSLTSATSFFTGGAHPNSGSSALLWDRVVDRSVAFADLFAPGASVAMLRPAYCRALDAERLRRRQGQAGGPFDDCPPFTDLTVAPVDADLDGRFDTIRFIADPYVAGPYAEGKYSIDLPVDAAFLAALRPAARGDFEPR